MKKKLVLFLLIINFVSVYGYRFWWDSNTTGPHTYEYVRFPEFHRDSETMEWVYGQGESPNEFMPATDSNEWCLYDYSNYTDSYNKVKANMDDIEQWLNNNGISTIRVTMSPGYCGIHPEHYTCHGIYFKDRKFWFIEGIYRRKERSKDKYKT